MIKRVDAFVPLDCPTVRGSVGEFLLGKGRGLSPSSVSMFEGDRLVWYNKYVRGIDPFPANVHRAMVGGTVFDRLYKDRLVGLGLGVNMETLADRMRSDDEVLLWDGDYTIRGVVEKEFNAGVWFEDEPPATNYPALLEETLRVVWDGVPILCKPDYSRRMGGSLVIRDVKTSGWVAQKVPSPPPGFVWDSKTRACHSSVVGLVDKGVCSSRPLGFKWGLQLDTYGEILNGLEPALNGVVVEVLWVTVGRRCRYAYRWASDCTIIERYKRVWDYPMDRLSV